MAFITFAKGQALSLFPVVSGSGVHEGIQETAMLVGHNDSSIAHTVHVEAIYWNAPGGGKLTLKDSNKIPFFVGDPTQLTYLSGSYGASTGYPGGLTLTAPIWYSINGTTSGGSSIYVFGTKE